MKILMQLFWITIICVLVFSGCTPYITLPSANPSSEQSETSPAITSESDENKITQSPKVTSSNSSPKPVIQKPSSPTNLIVKAKSNTEAYLQWTDTSNNEDGFRIYRDGILIDSTEANGLTFSDNGLQSAETYNYMVQAYNSSGESATCSGTIKMPNPPLNVTINYVGVKNDHDHWSPPGEIKLYALISDGIQTQELYLPESKQYPLNDYETTARLNEHIFRTSSVGEYLKIVFVAMEEDGGNSTLLNIISGGSKLLLEPTTATIVGVITSLFSDNPDDYVGSYSGYWTSTQNWGIGQYNVVGTDDLRIWFSIWSDTEPNPATLKPGAFSVESYSFSPKISTLGDTVSANVSLSGGIPNTYTLGIWKDIDLAADELVTTYTINHDGNITSKNFSFAPTSLGRYHMDLKDSGTGLWSQPNDTSRLVVTSPAPDVKIENVDLPSIVTLGQAYNYNVTLRNYSSNQASVSLSIDSSITGHVSTTPVTLSAKSSKNVQIKHIFTQSGVRTITYKVLYNNQTLYSLTKNIEAKTALAFSINSYSFSPNSINLGQTSTARITFTGGSAGTYTLGVWKDIDLAPDELVTTYTINHDGGTSTKSYSFTPTNAGRYHMDLKFNNINLWSQPNDTSRLIISTSH